jgi:hypothetical protein
VQAHKRPAVAAAISEAIQLDLTAVAAPMAYRVAKSLLRDEQVFPLIPSSRASDIARAVDKLDLFPEGAARLRAA